MANALAVLAEDTGLTPITHIWFTAFTTPALGESTVSSDLRAPHGAQTYM